MITAILVVLVILLVVVATAAGSAIRVLREYERGVVFRLGRLMDQRGPGLILLAPGIDRMVKISLRTVTLKVPPQEIITRDNVPARVTAVAYYRVVDPNRAVVEVQNYGEATLQVAQTTLRSVLGGADLDTLLSQRDSLNENLQHIIDSHTEPWGIKVTAVEIKDVEIPERMQHAIARQAEAERERRAKIINAEGEAQAAAKLAEAADVIAVNPVTIQLRYLQTLREIGADQNSTVVFPLPLDLIKPFLGAIAGKPAGADSLGSSAGAELPVGRSAVESSHAELPVGRSAVESGGAELPAVRSAVASSRAELPAVRSAVDGGADELPPSYARTQD